VANEHAATRRQVIAGAALIGASAMVNRGAFAVHAATTKKYARRVVDLHVAALCPDAKAEHRSDQSAPQHDSSPRTMYGGLSKGCSETIWAILSKSN